MKRLPITLTIALALSLFALCQLPAGAATFSKTFDPAVCSVWNVTSSGTVTCTAPIVPSGTGDPSVGAISCPGFATTHVIDAQFTLGAGYRYFTDRQNTYSDAPLATGFYAANAIVVRFTAPLVADPTLLVEMYETGTNPNGRPMGRTVVLSTQACDFTVPKSVNALYAAGSNQHLSLALRTDGGATWGQYNLIPGGQYFINVKNFTGATNNCSAAGFARCDVFFSFYNPR